MHLRLLAPRRNSALLMMAVMILSTLFLGCSEDTAIRKYSVAKKDVQRKRPSDKVEGQEKKMLGVIIPNGKSAWYFKMEDDPEKVEKYESDFRKMAESLSFTSSGSPQWELSDGWKDEIVRQIVYARLTHEADGISATITQLPATTADESSWRNNVYENVNRWRRLLSLTPQDWESMEAELQEVPKLSQGTAKAYLVSLVGKKAEGGMNAPFMNQMTSAVPPARTEEPEATPEPAAAPAAAPAAPKLSYTAPENWEEEKSEQGGIRKAAFEIKNGDETASVTVSTASVKPEMLLGMWFQQLGMEATEEAQQEVLDATESFDVNGVEATLYAITGKDGDSILVVRIPWTERESLFAKMTGASSVVSAERAAFTEFVKSMNW